jgi:hypothetical protein
VWAQSVVRWETTCETWVSFCLLLPPGAACCLPCVQGTTPHSTLAAAAPESLAAAEPSLSSAAPPLQLLTRPLAACAAVGTCAAAAAAAREGARQLAGRHSARGLGSHNLAASASAACAPLWRLASCAPLAGPSSLLMSSPVPLGGSATEEADEDPFLLPMPPASALP